MQQNTDRSSSRRQSLNPSIFSLMPLFWLLLSNDVLQAQRSGGPSDTEACAICGIGLGLMILIPLFFIGLGIGLLIWVSRDGKSREMKNLAFWMLLVLFTNVIGLVIYLLARQKGDLVQCASCSNKRLQGSAKCPHCGNP